MYQLGKLKVISHRRDAILRCDIAINASRKCARTFNRLNSNMYSLIRDNEYFILVLQLHLAVYLSISLAAGQPRSLDVFSQLLVSHQLHL